MQNSALPHDLFINESGAINQKQEFHSAEICLKGLDYSYQFKLYRVASDSMQIIIKHNSGILDKMKQGQIFNLKYYSNKNHCSVSYHDTLVRNVAKADTGRFKGHYLVDLVIMKNSDNIEYQQI